MAKDTFKEMEALQQKIEQLKVEQQKMEENLIAEIGAVLKLKNAFKFDFNALIGGLISVIDNLASKHSQTEEWQQAGQKFRRNRLKEKSKRISQAEPEMA